MIHRLPELSRWPAWVLPGLALLVPVGMCALLLPIRDQIAHTNAALVLVLVVVAFASTGRRLTGILTALSAGLAFDYFLTEPYRSFSIDDRADLETAVLLLVVGVGVAELAAWGRRQQARASTEEGYLAGVNAVSAAVARGQYLPSAVLRRICDDLTQTLGLRSCRFDYGTGLGYPRLHRDGRVSLHGGQWDVFTGAPAADRPFELIAEQAGSFRGRFLMEAPAGLRLTHAQLRVATSLADEAGSVLANADASAAT